MILVGIHGAIGSGKDVAAAHLCRTRGFTRVAYGDALKEEVARILRRPLAAYAKEHPRYRFLGEDEAVARLIQDKPQVVRALIQAWGTELRRAEAPGYWVEKLRRRTEGLDRIVVPDVRFENEAAFVRESGGYLLKVVRPDHTWDDHASERDLDGWTNWDVVILNDGTVADLEAKVEAWAVKALPS